MLDAPHLHEEVCVPNSSVLTAQEKNCIMAGKASLKNPGHGKIKNFLLSEAVLVLVAVHYFAVAVSISSGAYIPR